MPTYNLHYPVLFEVWFTCEVAFLCWLEVYCFVFFLLENYRSSFHHPAGARLLEFFHEATSSLTVG